MSTYDDFMRDAGQPVVPTTASSPVSVYDQFMADAAKPVPPAAPVQSPSLLSQVGHQVGLTGRAALVGATALPNMLWNGFGGAINWATGSHIPHVDASATADYVGLPKPQGSVENVAQDAAGAMASVLPFAKAGQMIGQAASPVIAGIGDALTAQPGMQAIASGSGGAAAGAAKEEGLNPFWTGAAGLLSGVAGVAGASGITALSRMGVNAIRDVVAKDLPQSVAADNAAQGVNQAVKGLGPEGPQMYAPGQIDDLTKSIIPQVQQNPGVDVGTIARNQDFRDLGIAPTTGQITRDPNQFAQELNMRGLPTGAPLTNRLNQQSMQLRNNLGGLTGDAASPYAAGKFLTETLSDIDSGMQSRVSDAYTAAKNSSGAGLNVPLEGLAQDYATVLKNFGDKVPSGVRNNFNQYGLLTGTQNKTFSVDDAENLLKVINSNQSNDPATNAALSTLRTSVKNAVLSADDQGGAYAPARELAAQRFAMQDKIPALDAAASGNVAPDDFVRRFITNGKTDDVLALANLLKTSSPDAFGQMRNQIGSALHQSGFGLNPSGDTQFNPLSYAKALRGMGDAKLGAFYSPDEIAQLHTIGRVGSYMNSVPSASPVNFSNTGSTLMGLAMPALKRLPLVGSVIDGFQNRSFVNNALSGSMSPMRAPGAPIDPNSLAAALTRLPVPSNDLSQRN